MVAPVFLGYEVQVNCRLLHPLKIIARKIPGFRPECKPGDDEKSQRLRNVDVGLWSLCEGSLDCEDEKMSKLTKPAGPQLMTKAVLLIRLMVGTVFLMEGILKFLYPEELGAGRFAEIGIPMAGMMGPFVAGVETLCGTLVLAGLGTRLAAIPLIIDISIAIISTKVPVLLGHGFWGFALPKVAHYGILGMIHEARTDFSMWLGLVFLLVTGPGWCSLDSLFARRAEAASR